MKTGEEQNLFGVGILTIKELRSYLSTYVSSTRARLLGQMGTDMNDVVGDHSESDPASDAGPVLYRVIGATHADV